MAKKKARELDLGSKRQLIDPDLPGLSVRCQCALIGLARASYYYTPVSETPENLEIMALIDRIHLDHPFYGRRRMVAVLKQRGRLINHKRARRLMAQVGISAMYPKPRTTNTSKEHKKFPYLLRGVKANRVNHVWSTDITYVPVSGGYLYLTAVMDWYSRFVLAWRLSNNLEARFCIETLLDALRHGTPDIFNTDQGVQYTSLDFVSELESRGIAVSMDGKGRALDNVFIERLWRTVKYEEVYLKAYESGIDAHSNLAGYFDFYNNERPHQSLSYRPPREVFLGEIEQLSSVAVTEGAPSAI